MCDRNPTYRTEVRQKLAKELLHAWGEIGKSVLKSPAPNMNVDARRNERFLDLLCRIAEGKE